MNNTGRESSIDTEGFRPRIRALANDGELGGPPTLAPQAASYPDQDSGYAAPIAMMSYLDAPAPSVSGTPAFSAPPPVPSAAWEPEQPDEPQFLTAPPPPPLTTEPPISIVPPVPRTPPAPAWGANAGESTAYAPPTIAFAGPVVEDTAAATAQRSFSVPEPGFPAGPPAIEEIEWTPTFSPSSPETMSPHGHARVDEPEDDAGFWSVDDDSSDINPQASLTSADRELVAALQEVLLAGASDLHVTVNAPPMIRVDGGLRPIADSYVWDRPRVSAALRSILNPLQRENFERELELDFAYTISANARFRVNIYQQRGSMGAAFRLIPTEIKPLAELGVPDAVSRFATLARGLVLVTGPTGSGKSTTLAALVDLVNRTRADHIVTVEDPIEFLHKNHKSLVNQREVGPDTHSFGAALKHVLRQDPDVILIGELRDLETISVALTAAETGHLVFATLHTQDAAQTIDRVIDVFPPHQQGQVRSQLAAVLQGVVCQTLVKRASGKGRVVATEVLVMTPAVANLIREGKTYQIPSALQAGRELGMYTMDQHLAELVDVGQITHQAAMEKAHDAEGIKRLIHRADPGSGGAGNTMASSGIDFGDGTSVQVAR